jgi:hypothetical protein
MGGGASLIYAVNANSAFIFPFLCLAFHRRIEYTLFQLQVITAVLSPIQPWSTTIMDKGGLLANVELHMTKSNDECTNGSQGVGSDSESRRGELA